VGEFDVFNNPVEPGGPDDFSAFDKPVAPPVISPKALARAAQEPVQMPGSIEAKLGPGIGERVATTVKELPGRFVEGVKGLGRAATTIGHIAAHPTELGDAATRRQLLRGVDDALTLGYGQKLAARIGNAFGDTPETALGPETFGSAPVANTQQADALAAPDARAAGNLAGAFMPGATALGGKFAGKIAGKVARGTGILPGAARGLASYEIAAPALAGASAGAAGRRAEAIGDAATDPLGVLMAASAGAAAEVPKAVEKHIANAKDSAGKWVARDVIGDVKSASTPTARKQLADDAATVPRLVLGDKQLDEAISNARHGGINEIAEAKDVVRKRLDAVGTRLSPGWRDVEDALPQPLTSGQVVTFLEDRVEDLRATGRTTDAAEADAVNAIAQRLRNARDWGATKVKELEPKAAQDVADLQKIRRNVRDPGAAAQIDQQIVSIRATATPRTKWDPNHRVPLEQLQKLWSDEAGIAYDSAGGINGTAAFKAKLDVAAHLRELRDRLLDQAERNDPKAVQAIAGDLKDYSGLKRIEKVLDQRANHAKANAEGASVPAGVVKFAKELKHGGVLGPVSGKAIELGVDALRGYQKWVARNPDKARALLSGTGRGRAIREAIAAGLPRHVALWAAQQAARAPDATSESK
jgi:hypothetical protein